MCDPRESLDSERANALKAGVRIRAENRRLDEIAYVEQIPPVSFPKLHGEKSPRPETYGQEKQKLLSYITAHMVRRNWCVCGGARGFFLQFTSVSRGKSFPKVIILMPVLRVIFYFSLVA